jgi:hypothetical protein
MIDQYLSRLTSTDLSNLANIPYNQLESIKQRIDNCKDMFYEYYFTIENQFVHLRKYNQAEKKNLESTVRTLYHDTPFAQLENGWILGKSAVHFYFNSLNDFSVKYEQMANVSWHTVRALFSTKCSFCSPNGFYVGVDCNRMDAIKKLFTQYPKSKIIWDKKIEEYLSIIDTLLKKQLSAYQTGALLALDQDSNGEVDLVENDFYKILAQNQKRIIEIDRSYVQQFVMISNYIKDKRINTQKIFESIRETENQNELEARVGLIKNQVFVYEQLVFHSISMITALLSDDMITFSEIYISFDKMGIFNSNWQNEVSAKLDGIGNKLNELLVSIYQLENSLVSELSNLSYITSESFSSLRSAMEKQLGSIQSSISLNNLLSGIQSYKLYKLNQKLLS